MIRRARNGVAQRHGCRSANNDHSPSGRSGRAWTSASAKLTGQDGCEGCIEASECYQGCWSNLQVPRAAPTGSAMQEAKPPEARERPGCRYLRRIRRGPARPLTRGFCRASLRACEYELADAGGIALFRLAA